MINWLKNWYVHEYQSMAYAITVARTEYDRLGGFVTPTLIILTPIKLFFPIIPWWVLPVALLVTTVSAYWIGTFLIIMGVPKKATELGNRQNPQIMEILERLERIENGTKK